MKLTLSYLKSLSNYRHIIYLLSIQDIKQRYRRSFLGPFWLTIHLSLMIFILYFVLNNILKTKEYFLIYLSSSLILWNFILSLFQEGTLVLIHQEAMIKQYPLPPLVFIFQALFRQCLYTGHHLLVLPFIFIIDSISFGSISWIDLILGIPLFLMNIVSCFVIATLLCTRFRDVPPIIQSILQAFFYITPILWSPDMLKNSHISFWIDFNPLYQWISLIRMPLLGQELTMFTWIYAFSTLLVTAGCASWSYSRYHQQVPYWV